MERKVGADRFSSCTGRRALANRVWWLRSKPTLPIKVSSCSRATAFRRPTPLPMHPCLTCSTDCYWLPLFVHQSYLTCNRLRRHCLGICPNCRSSPPNSLLQHLSHPLILNRRSGA